MMTGMKHGKNMAEITLSLKLRLWQNKCSVFCTCYRFETWWFFTWKISVTGSESLSLVIQLTHHCKPGLLKNVFPPTLMLQMLMHYIHGQMPQLWSDLCLLLVIIWFLRDATLFFTVFHAYTVVCIIPHSSHIPKLPPTASEVKPDMFSSRNIY